MKKTGQQDRAIFPDPPNQLNGDMAVENNSLTKKSKRET